MDSKKSPKAIRLQTRLILYSTLLIVLIMALVFLLVEKRQSETIQEEAKNRGMAIAQNLASVSTNALLTYNYVILEQNAERVALEEDISYVIIHDKESKVAAYSQHDEKQGMLLTDDVSQRALVAKEPSIQSTFSNERTRLLDISIPVYIKESHEKWGTVRVGLSLERMYEQISKTRFNLLLLGLFTILLGILGSIFFARRITQPISRLVETTVAAARGDLDQEIDVLTGDEIEELSRNFNHMIEQIRLHRNELEKRLREITSLKTYTNDTLASMTNGLITVDLEKKIVTVNDMAEKIIGRGREGMAGFTMEEILNAQHPLTQTPSRNPGTGKRNIPYRSGIGKGRGKSLVDCRHLPIGQWRGKNDWRAGNLSGYHPNKGSRRKTPTSGPPGRIGDPLSRTGSRDQESPFCHKDLRSASPAKDWESVFYGEI